jgi:glycosyltransferase involved in cell wall biosynthesis
MKRLIIDLTMCFARGRAAVHGGGEYGKAAAVFLGGAVESLEVVGLVRSGDAERAAAEIGDQVVLRSVADGPLQSLPGDLDGPDNVLFLPLPAHFLERGEPCRARMVAVEHGLRDHEKAEGLHDHLCHPLLGSGLERWLLCGYAGAIRRKRLRRARQRYRRRLAPLRRDDILVTPSHHSKYAMRLAFGDDTAVGGDRGLLDNIRVLPPLTPFLHPPEPSRGGQGTAGILLLSVNRPLKNGDRFLEGIRRHRIAREAANRVGIDLVGSDDALRQRLERRFGDALELRFHPYVDEAELERLLHEARVFAFPSLSEGYGIPPVAAFAHGTPVVAAATTAVNEVAGGAAMLADPLQGSEMANRVLEILEDDKRRIAVGQAGVRRYTELKENALAAWREFVELVESPCSTTSVGAPD